jgi:hypothetical protein
LVAAALFWDAVTFAFFLSILLVATAFGLAVVDVVALCFFIVLGLETLRVA